MAKRPKTTPEAVVNTMVGVVPSGQAVRAPFSRTAAINSFRSWVYAAAMKNAQQVAATPLRLYVRERPGSKLFRTRSVSTARKSFLLGETARAPSSRTVSKLLDFGSDFTEVVERHPILDLLRKVNPWLGGFDAMTLTVLYGELTGDWYWVPVQSQYGPNELWILQSQRVEIVPDREKFIAGYLYGRDTGKGVMFTPEECIHGRYPNPANPWYGLGKVEAGWGVVQKQKAVEDFDLASFQNNARPDYALVVKSGAAPKEMDAFEAQVRAKLEGVKRAGRFLAITGDVSLQPLSWPPKDMAGRDDIVEEIAAVFGVPVTILKANDPNLASAQIGYASWKEMTILPICRMMEDFINQQLLPMYGIEDDACVAFDDPVPKNRMEERADAESSLRNGRITLNEDRIESGRDPYPDPLADVPLINGQPLGYTPPSPFGAVTRPAEPQAPAPAEEPKPAPKPEPEDDDQMPEAAQQKAVPPAVAAAPAPIEKAAEPAPLPITDADRIAEMVKRHNAEHPDAPVSLDEAVKVYEGAVGSKAEDAIATLIGSVLREVEAATDPQIEAMVKELAHVG